MRFYGQTAPFDVIVCAEHTGRLPTSSGFDVHIEFDWDVIREADWVIVPSWDPGIEVKSELKTLLVEAWHRGATLAGLCVGAYALAACGLLDGKTATTHWGYADDFRARFAAVELNAEPLFIEHERLITSAGTAAALDCCLHLLRNALGVQTASNIARRLVAAPYRSGGQQQYIDLPLPDKPSDDRIRKMMDKVSADLAADHTIDEVAAMCAMSRRHFSRVFRQVVGSSFVEWLTTARLKYAQQLLEFSELPVARVAEQAGFKSQENFRKQFRQVFAVSPSQWRATFAQK